MVKSLIRNISLCSRRMISMGRWTGTNWLMMMDKRVQKSGAMSDCAFSRKRNSLQWVKSKWTKSATLLITDCGIFSGNLVLEKVSVAGTDELQLPVQSWIDLSDGATICQCISCIGGCCMHSNRFRRMLYAAGKYVLSTSILHLNCTLLSNRIHIFFRPLQFAWKTLTITEMHFWHLNDLSCCPKR